MTVVLECGMRRAENTRILNEQDHLMIGESDVTIATLAFDPHGRRIVSGAFSNTLRLLGH